MHVERWSSNAKGRSHTVAYGNMVWTVANATDAEANFEVQVAQSLQMLDAHLKQAGSARTHLLSLQVILTDIGNALTAHRRDKHNVTGSYFLRRKFSNLHKPYATDNNVAFEGSFEAMPASCYSGFHPRPGN